MTVFFLLNEFIQLNKVFKNFADLAALQNLLLHFKEPVPDENYYFCLYIIHTMILTIANDGIGLSPYQ